jgi:hypothetical protein
VFLFFDDTKVVVFFAKKKDSLQRFVRSTYPLSILILGILFHTFVALYFGFSSFCAFLPPNFRFFYDLKSGFVRLAIKKIFLLRVEHHLL